MAEQFNDRAQLENLVRELSARMVEFERRLISWDDLSGPQRNDGDTAWVMTSTALVLFMTMPGLALFYSGMIRTKNVLATLMQSFTICCVITFLWLCFGYSLTFTPTDELSSTNAYQFIGGSSRMWLNGMTTTTYHFLATTIPENVFCMYQLTFAIITAALITGSFADRMKYHSMIIFISIWHVVVYCPVAHSCFHQNGFLRKAGALDFAGGNVVHIAAGVSGLVSAVVLGHRKGYGKERFDPHNIILTFIGMAMLWVGWFGFNAGSAVAANGSAGYAMLVTHISASTASLSWMSLEWIIRGQPSVLGMVNGAVAGLVTITPMSGYVDQTGAFVAGFLAGPVCYFGAQIKHYAGYDDALDAFGVHAIGGILGGILTGFFATPNIGLGANGKPTEGVFYGSLHTGGYQLAMQLYAIACTILYAGFCSWCILVLIDRTIGLRVTADQEQAGLDSSLHGESMETSQVELTKSGVGISDLVPTTEEA